MLQAVPRVIQFFRKIYIFPLNTYEKYIYSRKNCIARHDDKICFLANCRYHIKLLGVIRELLENERILFQLPTRGLLYTIFNNRLSGKIVVKSGQLFDILQRAVPFNHQNRGVDRMPRSARTKFLRRKYDHQF